MRWRESRCVQCGCSASVDHNIEDNDISVRIHRFENQNRSTLENLNLGTQCLWDGGTARDGSLASSCHYFVKGAVTVNRYGGGTCNWKTVTVDDRWTVAVSKRSPPSSAKWYVRWEHLSGNDDRECSVVTLTTSRTSTMSLHGGTIGACKHVSILMLKSVMELRKSV